ncbi:MAG: FAD:protein FMN transferase [Phycisphaerales bacterium]|nr:FAD:protein FMN transferase [Phycisphaerales bacterium]
MMLQLGCHAGLERHEFQAIRMGSPARVVLYAPNAARASDAAQAAFASMASLEQILSDWRLDSEVMMLRGAAPGVWIAISPPLADAIDRSLEIHGWTGGAFDPTCGRMTDAWRRHRSSGEIPKTAPFCWTGRGVERLMRRGDSLRFADPVPWLDFGGIGKGLAADAALEAMRTRGVTAALVELGGDLAVGDPPPGKAGWTIRISGRADAPPLVRANCGIATSGAGEQHIGSGVDFVSHIVDPRTGQWVGPHPDVTVVADSAGEADALASAGCVLGAKALRRLLERHHPAGRSGAGLRLPVVLGGS